MSIGSFSQKMDEEEEELKGPTLYLVVINFIFYVITSIIGGNIIITGRIPIILFGLSIQTLLAGFIWTPFTSMFVHSNLAHLGGNMLFLLLYGFNIEERDYDDNFIYISYLVTGLISGMLSAPIIGFKTISIGASGAVFGLLGVIVGIERRERTANYKSLVFTALILFIFSNTQPNTNIFAHLFGLISGIVLGNSEYAAKYKIK